MSDKKNQVHQVTKHTPDITTHTQTVQQLWESEHRYRSLFEAANDAVFILDLQGNHLTVNQKAAQMLGYEREELSNLSFRDIVVVEEHHHSENVIERLLAGESLDIYEKLFRRKDGTIFPVEVNVLLVKDRSGEPLHFQSIIRDISQRKEAEQELRAAYEQLKVLDHLRSEFVSNVSHELRTPITSLKLYHDLLHLQPEKIDKYQPIMQQQVKRLEEIVESMLVMLQIQQDIAKSELGVLDLNNLVKSVVSAQQNLADNRQITLIIDTYPENILVLADSDLLKKAITAIIDNALKYSFEQGNVTIQVDISNDKEQKWVHLKVTDTGPGIPDEEALHIFEKFYRGKRALETGTYGAGLGLAIAQAIIKQHHGFIEGQNRIDFEQGAEFSFRLPVVD